MAIKYLNLQQAYDDIVTGLFGPDAYITDNMINRGVFGWIESTCVLTTNRWKKTWKQCVAAVEKLQSQVTRLHDGECSSMS